MSEPESRLLHAVFKEKHQSLWEGIEVKDVAEFYELVFTGH